MATSTTTSGSGGLVPSKSTIYVSNLPFSLTNNDLHKIFEKYGRVAKVTILKNNDRQSKGVAFVLFIERDSAYKTVRALNNTQMFGRTIRCSIAKDNGRASDFIKRKTYADKSRCYECGEDGHLSYNCTKNLLGDREPPPKKKKRKKDESLETDQNDSDSDDTGNEDDSAVDSLAAAIKYQSVKMGAELGYRMMSEGVVEEKKRRYKKDTYFSDEEAYDDD